MMNPLKESADIDNKAVSPRFSVVPFVYWNEVQNLCHLKYKAFFAIGFTKIFRLNPEKGFSYQVLILIKNSGKMHFRDYY